MQIDPKQQEAILHQKGPAMVVAGPGSGKTAVITRRIDRLIEKLNIPPEKIMVITFTRAAAEEMKSRFRAFPGRADAPVFFATFHAAFYRILRREEGLAAGSVLDRAEKEKWIRELLRAEQAEERSEAEFVDDLASELSFYKAGAAGGAPYRARCCDTALFLRVFDAYEERLRVSGKVDFEDMLNRTKHLLETQPEVLKIWRERYPFILVDEFQDINRIQYDILRLLAGPENNLFAAGDDDQSIYRFRGAEPGIMQRFAKDFPGAARYELFGCYRCSPAILALCKKLIGCNTDRFRKELFSLAPARGGPQILDFPDRAAEREALVRTVKALNKGGVPYREMAVLCRTNFELCGLPAVLERAGIPCRTKGPMPDLYHTQEAGDLFAYLELASGKRSRSLFLRIANRPLRFIPRAVFAADPVDPGRLLAALSNRPKQLEEADRLLYQIERLAGMRPFAAVDFIRRKIGYDAWRKEITAGRASSDRSADILDALQEESAYYPDWESWKKAIRSRDAERIKDAAGDRAEEKTEAVTLTTMHGAKGLEYDAVFLPDLNEGVIPHKKSLEDKAVEEERRLLYVAMTRARSFLWIAWVRKNRAGRCEPSRFMKDML